eukprot:gnl/MRDRNA2_/MRDRNA2_103599_c0_seq1.p1 gnl/MRDRNA2_/MRDRNA2_103599_c0~~gnl/MRDRNA2_/MRDRNA2_103599_c0_seq1.p1  ORF type:complete len:437 (+),score=75.68 gnl/MRDRNA2_/MRDRNA2_103599_c0_seq1:178-1488(+)
MKTVVFLLVEATWLLHCLAQEEEEKSWAPPKLQTHLWKKGEKKEGKRDKRGKHVDKTMLAGEGLAGHSIEIGGEKITNAALPMKDQQIMREKVVKRLRKKHLDPERRSFESVLNDSNFTVEVWWRARLQGVSKMLDMVNDQKTLLPGESKKWHFPIRHHHAICFRVHYHTGLRRTKCKWSFSPTRITTTKVNKMSDILPQWFHQPTYINWHHQKVSEDFVTPPPPNTTVTKQFVKEWNAAKIKTGCRVARTGQFAGKSYREEVRILKAATKRKAYLLLNKEQRAIKKVVDQGFVVPKEKRIFRLQDYIERVLKEQREEKEKAGKGKQAVLAIVREKYARREEKRKEREERDKKQREEEDASSEEKETGKEEQDKGSEEEESPKHLVALEWDRKYNDPFVTCVLALGSSMLVPIGLRTFPSFQTSMSGLQQPLIHVV